MIFSKLLVMELSALFAVLPVLGGGYGDRNNLLLHFFVLIILSTWLIACSISGTSHGKKTGIFLPFSVFLLSVFVSNVFSVSPRESWLETRLFMDYFALFVVTATFPLPVSGVRKLFFFFGAVSALLSVYALFSVFVTFPAIPGHPLSQIVPSGKPQRAFSTFIHPNVFGSYLAAGCLFILGSLQAAQNKVLRGFLMTFLALNCMALFFTYSFGVGIFFGVVIVLTILLSRSPLFLIKQIALAVCFAIVASVLAVRYIGNASSDIKKDVILLTDARTKKTSFAGRVSLWRTAAHVSSNYFMFGSGLRTFKLTGLQAQRDAVYSVYPHSMILQTLSETGIFSVFGLLWALLFILFKMKKIMQVMSGSEERPFAVSVFLCVLYICLHGVIDFEWNIPLFPLMVSCFSGIFIGLKDMRGEPLSCGSSGVRTRPRSKLPLTLCFVLILLSLSLKCFVLAAAYHRFEKAQFLILSRDYSRAYRILKRGERTLAREGKYHSMMAKIYENSGELEKASRHAQKAIDLEPYVVSHLGQGARLYQRQGLFQNAREKLGRALKLCPYCVDYRYGMAMIAMQEKKKQEVKTILLDIDGRLPAYEKVQNVPQVYVLVYLLLGDLYGSEGDKSRALLYYRKALKHFPGNPEVLKRLSSKT